MSAVPETRPARRRRWLPIASAVLVLAIVAVVLAWPTILRHVVLAQLHSITHRPVTVELVEVNPFTGRIALRNLRVQEPDGSAPFAGIDRVDARVRPLSLLRGHVWLSDVTVGGLDVRLVRRASDFNISDLLEPSGPSGRTIDLTVDRLALSGGTVVMEDRALREPRTWTSEQIEIEANGLSTMRGGGTAMARSITAGAPVSVDLREVRLAPVHLEAVVETTGLDIGLARIYLPPGAPVIVERGRASSRVAIVLDAASGVRADVNGELTDVALVRPGEKEPAAIVPRLQMRVSGLAYGDDALAIDVLELTGSASVRDPSKSGARYKATTVRASVGDVTWPVTRPGKLDVESSVPGGGTVRVTGQLRPPPAASQLRLRASGVDLAPWAELVPLKGRIAGVAEADLSVDEPLEPGVPNRVRGTVAVNRPSLGDGARELVGAERVEASSFEVQWPTRVSVARLALKGPRAIVERAASGEFPLRAWVTPAPASQATVTSTEAKATGANAPAIAVDVGEVVVDGGRLAWRDDAVKPRASIDVSAIDARVKGAAWPLRGRLDVTASARTPGGGNASVSGKVGMDPISADVRLTTRDVELAPYQSYVTIPARVAGRADLDVTAVMPSLDDGRAAVKGRASIVRLDVRDSERSILRADRAAVSGLDVDWPRRVHVGEVALRQPWVLIERGKDGITPMTVLVPSAPATSAKSGAAAPANGARSNGGKGVPATIDRITVEDGGARVVDQQVAPPFALDMQRLDARLDGLSTDPAAKPAKLDVKGRVGGTSILTVAGTLGTFGGPLRVDIQGDLRGFAVPRTNPYLLNQVAWEARDGWLTTAFRCRIDGDTLEARSEIQVSRLQVAKAGEGDQAKARIGLPLGMLVSLMKDSRGDIKVALPVSGKLSDPKFDFSEAIWSTLKTVAVKTVMAPISWIGRVRLTSDSRIDRIEIDPIPFAPGQVTLSPEAREQASRVAAFLAQSKEVRMSLTPMVTARDRAAVRQGSLDVAIERLAREERLTPEAAAEKLFKERFPQQPVPAAPEAVRAALAEGDKSPGPDFTEMAEKRLAAVRDAITKAGVDGDRLKSGPPSTAGTDGEGRVALDLVEPESPGPASKPGLLKRIFGGAAPATAAAARR